MFRPFRLSIDFETKWGLMVLLAIASFLAPANIAAKDLAPEEVRWAEKILLERNLILPQGRIKAEEAQFLISSYDPATQRLKIVPYTPQISGQGIAERRLENSKAQFIGMYSSFLEAIRFAQLGPNQDGFRPFFYAEVDSENLRLLDDLEFYSKSPLRLLDVLERERFRRNNISYPAIIHPPLEKVSLTYSASDGSVQIETDADNANAWENIIAAHQRICEEFGVFFANIGQATALDRKFKIGPARRFGFKVKLKDWDLIHLVEGENLKDNELYFLLRQMAGLPLNYEEVVAASNTGADLSSTAESPVVVTDIQALHPLVKPSHPIEASSRLGAKLRRIFGSEETTGDYALRLQPVLHRLEELEKNLDYYEESGDRDEQEIQIRLAEFAQTPKNLFFRRKKITRRIADLQKDIERTEKILKILRPQRANLRNHEATLTILIESLKTLEATPNADQIQRINSRISSVTAEIEDGLRMTDEGLLLAQIKTEVSEDEELALMRQLEAEEIKTSAPPPPPPPPPPPTDAETCPDMLVKEILATPSTPPPERESPAAKHPTPA